MNIMNIPTGLFMEDSNIVDAELKETNFDRGQALAFAYRNRGSIRLSLGLFYTKEEWKERKVELSKKPLP